MSAGKQHQAFDILEEPESLNSRRRLTDWKEKLDPLGFICIFNCIIVLSGII